MIEVRGVAVTSLLDPADGRLGCRRARGSVSVASSEAVAWVIVERGDGVAKLDGVVIDVSMRAGVFEGAGWSALIAPGSVLHLDGDLDTSIVWTRGAGLATDTRVIDPASVAEAARGVGVTARRVRTYVSEGPLIVGETINPPGGWSSWPPHSHDHEEFYLYRFEPEHGFGVHVDLAGQPVTVRDGDIVRIRVGEHPVVAAPGCTMYYLWALAGDTPTVDTRVAPRFSP